MQTQIFDQTTAITSTAGEIFNSETYQGGILNVADAVFGGFALTNTGSAQAQLQLDIKVHPDAQWTTQTGMEGSFAVAFGSVLSQSLIRLSSISTGLIDSGATVFFSVSLKFVYAVRILSKMKTGSSGNSVRVRGNFKVPKNLSYLEASSQITATSIIVGASQPVWVDVSERAFFSAYVLVSGTGLSQSVAANTLTGVSTVNASGMFLGIRFYPDDTSVFWTALASNVGSTDGGLVTSIVIQSMVLTSSFRNLTFRFLVEGSYEMGVLFSLATGQTIDHYFSMNG